MITLDLEELTEADLLNMRKNFLKARATGK